MGLMTHVKTHAQSRAVRGTVQIAGSRDLSSGCGAHDLEEARGNINGRIPRCCLSVKVLYPASPISPLSAVSILYAECSVILGCTKGTSIAEITR